MSINKKDAIDVISTSPEGRVTLTISDHNTWDETWHLQLLQNKINSYLQFIESGQIFEDYPNAGGRELIIETVMQFEPNEEGISFLEKAKEIVIKAGIGFQWRRLQTDK